MIIHTEICYAIYCTYNIITSYIIIIIMIIILVLVRNKVVYRSWRAQGLLHFSVVYYAKCMFSVNEVYYTMFDLLTVLCCAVSIIIITIMNHDVVRHIIIFYYDNKVTC